MNLNNLLLALRDQLPLRRFIYNFLITRNAWGLFSINSHIAAYSGNPKIGYPTKESALRSATKMSAKHNTHFSSYKCAFCDKYHIGKNRNNKIVDSK